MDNEEKRSVQEEQFGEENNNPENTLRQEENSIKVEDAQTRENPESESDSFSQKKATGDVLEKNEPEDKKKDDVDEIKIMPVDYSTFEKEHLISRLSLLIEERPVNEIKGDIDRIKINFYKKHRSEFELKKMQFLNEGGELKDFKPVDDPLELNLKELLKQFRKKKSELNKTIEINKQENLKKKYEIINEIKDLINREESLHKTFQEFRDLQTRWRGVGIIPQQNVKDLWETYHHHVEKFYGFVKINKELRDLDLKKNQESKINLCETAEKILLESNVVDTYKTLQKYHDQWREIGPVPHENKNEIWERFKDVTAKINKRHHQYYQDLKDQQKNNLEKKTELCDKVEEINKQCNMESPGNWEKRADEIKKLQTAWRSIGFAPRKHNNKIYKKFREACDAFFQTKRNYYIEHKDVQNNNLKIKTDLCIQAESFQDSEDWKKTTDALIKLQKKWKEAGPVPRKSSEKVWKCFRAACDKFFERKSEYYSNRDEIFKDNYKLKKELISEIEKQEPVDDAEESFDKIKDFQRRWNEIGFVPFKQKDVLIDLYRSAINKQFDKLNIDEFGKNKLKYENKLEQLRESPKGSFKAKIDREKFYNRIKKTESDIVLWENNKGFFAKSANAESLIREIDEKIDKSRENVRLMEEKIKMIDQSDIDE